MGRNGTGKVLHRGCCASSELRADFVGYTRTRNRGCLLAELLVSAIGSESMRWGAKSTAFFGLAVLKLPSDYVFDVKDVQNKKNGLKM